MSRLPRKTSRLRNVKVPLHFKFDFFFQWNPRIRGLALLLVRMHHDITRRPALGIPNRIHIGAGGVRVHVGRERRHRLQSNKESAGSEYSRRELRRNLGGVGPPRRRNEDTGFDFIVLLHPDFAGPQGTSIELYLRRKSIYFFFLTVFER